MMIRRREVRLARTDGLTMHEAERIKRWWFKLVDSYRVGDADVRRNMLLKKQHTLRVRREALQLGRALGLSPAGLRMAEVIVLLHDVGRFEQYARYRTFNDPRSTNHAKLGLLMIRRSGILSALAPEKRMVIRRAILYHNRAVVPGGKPLRVQFFSQLLRDADKLDIWRLTIDYYNAAEGEKNHAISIGFKDTPGISPGVFEDICGKQIVKSEHLRNLNDLKLLQMGWVFDVNFLPTLQKVTRRRYLEKIREVLPDSPKVEKAYRTIVEHVDRRMATG
jgi:hypothetical protein